MPNLNLDESTREIQKSMSQIVHVEGSKVLSLGSALLIEYDQKFRLISAGHLINIEDYDKLLMPLPGTKEGLFIDTFGDLTTTNIQGDQEENQVDYAEIVFNKADLETKVKMFYTPIIEQNIDFNHEINENDSRYFVFGYPISRARFNYKKNGEMNSEPLRLTTYPIVQNEIYERNGFSKETHILLHIQRKISREPERVFLPKTKGISGCGVYFLPNLNEDKLSSEYKLVGVLTEVDFEKQFAVVVRMNTIKRNIE